MKRLTLTGLATLTLSFLIWGLCSVQTAQAASGGLTISPTSIDTTVAPGESYSGEVLIINQGELDYSYKVYVTPYSVTGEEYKPYFLPIKDAIDITNWFTIPKKDGSLKTGNQDTIPFTVQVPKATPAGSYYATIFAETEDKGASGVVTRKRVGTILYLKVSGKILEKGAIETWSVPWLQQSDLRAQLKIANAGSVHFQSKVTVRVSDIFGGAKFTFERTPQVLPQKIRKIDVVWENGGSFGLFKVNGEVSYLGKTEQLPTRYVFVANTTMRIVSLGVIVLFVGAMIWVGKKRVVRKQK